MKDVFRLNPLESWVLLHPPMQLPDRSVAATSAPTAPALPVSRPAASWRRWPTLLAWLVVALAVGLVLLRQDKPEPAHVTSDEDEMTRVMTQAQLRALVAGGQLTHEGPEAILQQARFLKKGVLTQRLRYVVLAGDFGGPTYALEELDVFEKALRTVQPQPTAEQRRLLAILRKLYREHRQLRWQAPAVSAEERQFLIDRLGWTGQLALQPPDPLDKRGLDAGLGGTLGQAVTAAPRPDAEARSAVMAPALRTFVGFMLGGFGFVVLLGLGALVLISAAVILVSGYRPTLLSSGAAHGGVYAETFAWWMVLFLGFSLVAQLLPLELPMMVRSLIAMPASLLALYWPVLRGVPWWQVRQDIGWYSGPHPWREVLAGIGCYLASLPLAALGLLFIAIYTLVEQGGLLSLGLASSADEVVNTTRAAHPIVTEIANADVWLILQLYLVAAVGAPLIEETMFRGVLHRHLREATHGLGLGWSVALSALLVSFIFAVIHPQGLLAVPVLMSLALGFTAAREWRGSLLGAMVGHGLNNGMAITIGLLLLRS